MKRSEKSERFFIFPFTALRNLVRTSVAVSGHVSCGSMRDGGSNATLVGDLGIGPRFMREANRNDLRTGPQSRRERPNDRKHYPGKHRKSCAACDFTNASKTVCDCHAADIARDVPLRRTVENV